MARPPLSAQAQSQTTNLAAKLAELTKPVADMEDGILVSAAYDGDRRLALLKFYDPKAGRMWLWEDNTGHKPYCFTRLEMGELEQIRHRKDVITIDEVERLDLLNDTKAKVRKIVTTDPLAIGGGNDSIRDIIRAWEAEHHKKPTPVLALTANGFEDEKQASLAAGCNAHLVKPVRKAELLEAIRAHIHDGARLNRQNQRIPIHPPAGIEEAIPLFLESTREDLQALARALENGEYPKVRLIGHDLKGSGGGFGFDQITVIGRSIEEAAKRSDGPEVAEQIAALTDYLDRVDVILG